MSKIIIGRYIPGDSIVYKMDPRGKIIATFLFIVIIFLANNWLSYFFLSIFTLLAVWATKLKPKVFWDGVKPLIWLILFTSVLQLFFTTGGKVYWQWGIFSTISNPVFMHRWSVINHNSSTTIFVMQQMFHGIFELVTIFFR